MDKIKRTFGFIFTHPLSKKHPLKSIWRLLIWQIQTSFSPAKFIIKPFIGPVNFYARRELTGITGNIYSGLHEFNDMAFLLHFLRAEDTFYDIGANVGSYTLLASGICQSKSIAIEPVKAAFNILGDNVTLNSLTEKVLLFNAGAGAKKDELLFSIHEDTVNHVIAKNEIPQANVIKVPVITIDSLLTYGLPQLIKIDVEGYETEVLKGMQQTLAQHTLKAIIIELNGSGQRYGFDENDIHDLLISKNFRPYIYDPFTRTLTEEKCFGTHNTIYCTDIDFVNTRIKQANSFKIMGELL